MPNTATDTSQLHAARSTLLDAFVDVEVAIVGLLKLSGTKVNGEMLKQKIESLRSVKPSPKYSKKKRAEVTDLLAKLEQLLDIRNDIAHGKLDVGIIAGEAQAVFVNARETSEVAPLARVLSLSAMARLQKEVAGIAKDFATIPTPPSSPPPPSPDAAAGP